MGHIYEAYVRHGECYGARLPEDWSGSIPKQMLCIDVPEAE